MDQFAAHLLWMAEDADAAGTLLPDAHRDALRAGPGHHPEAQVDVNTLEHIAAKTLALNEIGLCNVATSSPVALDPYAQNRETGAFILIDRFTHATAGAGMICFGLRRATNVHRQSLSIDKGARVHRNAHKPVILWFTGLSGSGKSTIANLVEQALHGGGAHTYLLDGDNVRHGLNRDLGFTDADRVENVRRVGEVAKLFTDAGLIVLCSFISPFRAERRMVRELVPEGEFIEVFVDTPLEECIRRDPKGLYARARAGLIKNFTGIDSPYEVPEQPELRLDTTRENLAQCAARVMALLRERQIVGWGGADRGDNQTWI